MKIQEVHIDKIEIANRFRTDLGDLDELVESIKKKGIIQPITVSPDLRLLAGERRIKAAEIAGLKKVPVLIRNVEDEQDAQEIELYENVHRKDMAWQDRSRLEKSIYDLEVGKRDGAARGVSAKLGKELGIPQTSMSRHLRLAEALEIIPELAECKTEKEAWRKLHRVQEKLIVKEIASRKSVKNAFKWADDHYKIGDCIEGLTDVSDGIVSLAEVDPPYAIGLAEKKRRLVEKHDVDIYNEWTPKEYEEKIKAVAEQVHRVLRDNTFCIWWFGPSYFQSTQKILRKVGFVVSDIPCIWYKGPIGQTNNPDMVLASSYEMFFVARKGRAQLGKKGRSNVFHFAPVPARSKIHPTERPLALMVELLNTFMAVPGIILSPFLGSGVTLRAAYSVGQVGFGYDLVSENKDRFITKLNEEQTEKEGEEDGTSKDK